MTNPKQATVETVEQIFADYDTGTINVIQAMDRADKLIATNYKSNSEILECVPKYIFTSDHTHVTKSYCLDCARRDGYEWAVREFEKALGLDKDVTV